jgi:pimeloyl-ACP methyl ester carboxylesterase
MRPAVLVLAALLALAGCRTPPPSPVVRDPIERISSAAADHSGATSSTPLADASTPPATEEGPATVERADVPGDVPTSFVRSRSGEAPRIVFLPGLCSKAYYYLLSFPEAARAHGGVVAIDGDKPCGAASSGWRSFSWDPVRQDARLRAAMAAAGAPEMPEGLTLVGYSAGAGIAELMVQRWPKRYARVVLIGAPSDPSPARLSGAEGVVTMSCSRDVPARMRDAAQRITRARVPAMYLEMPGCTHGNIADGEHVFETAFEWLTENASPRGS